MAGLPIAVCDDESVGRETAARRYGTYANIPTYARMLARGDAESPADVAVVGSESVIEAKLREYEDVGVTDLVAMVFAAGADDATRADSRRRTMDLLSGLAKRA
jgi:hypothetical protein